MAFTDADLTEINKSIARGILRVRWPDGSETTYQTTSDLLRARAAIKAELAAASSGRTGTIKTILTEF